MPYKEYLWNMQLQTTSPESQFPNEYSDVIFIQIDQHLKKLLQKIQRGPDFMNHGVEWFLKTFIDYWFFYQRSMLFLLNTFTQRRLLYSNLCVYSFVSCAFVICY